MSELATSLGGLDALRRGLARVRKLGIEGFDRVNLVAIAVYQSSLVKPGEPVTEKGEEALENALAALYLAFGQLGRIPSSALGGDPVPRFTCPACGESVIGFDHGDETHKAQNIRVVHGRVRVDLVIGARTIPTIVKQEVE